MVVMVCWSKVCEGKMVDVMAVLVWWSKVCEGRMVDVMVWWS
jgi:hypothetical protein